LEKRLKFARGERLKAIQDIDRLQAEIWDLDQDLSELSPKIKELEAKIMEGEHEMEETRLKMNRIADEIFKEFCTKCEVKDIREFEQHNIRFSSLFFFFLLTSVLREI
jgi:predicted  nucleic acid-binding Zn-ribbon protein